MPGRIVFSLFCCCRGAPHEGDHKNDEKKVRLHLQWFHDEYLIETILLSLTYILNLQVLRHISVGYQASKHVTDITIYCIFKVLLVKPFAATSKWSDATDGQI